MVGINAIKLSLYTDIFLDQIHNHIESKHLLKDINVPLLRMDDNLRNIQDGIQGKWFSKGTNYSLMAPRTQAPRDFTMDVNRTIYSTSRADKAGCAFRNRAMAPL